jgi:Spy/CpxP family protein refolding chaperone
MNQIARWKVVLSLAAIFLAGSVTGALFTIAIAKHEVRRQSDPTQWFQVTMQRWKTRLHLTAAQEEKLKPIVEATVSELRTLRTNDLRQTDEILARAQTRIDPELTADQRQRLQKMRDARKRRLQEWLNIPGTDR